MNPAQILLIEPFYGGSHKQLIDLLCSKLEGCVKYTLTGKKWPWKARTSALHFSQVIPRSLDYRILLSSSVLNLAELVALRPDLGAVRTIIYFHENQLEYPVRKCQDRDFQFGYNQILSCLVADKVVFNSAYNMKSFLSHIDSHLKLMPNDLRPRDLRSIIEPKCSVLYFPLKCCDEKKIIINRKELVDQHYDATTCEMPKSSGCNAVLQTAQKSSESTSSTDSQINLRPTSQLLQNQILHIVWPHRWEHDKNPQSFFDVVFKLQEEGLPFYMSVLGECYSEVPAVFNEARRRLVGHIKNWGYQENLEDYHLILDDADIVVSTSNHEFYGVAMLEAVWRSCFPLCPNRLVYPEIFPEQCLYNTDNQLFKRLKNFCKHPHQVKKQLPQIDFSKYSWAGLESGFRQILAQDGS